MAKTILGVDIGYDQLKMALVRGNRVLKIASGKMPENLLKEGRITSVEALSELLKTTMKQNGIHASHAACTMSVDAVYIKNVVLPHMSEDQLIVNLPYEFNDYITDEVDNYIFDYAVQEIHDNTAQEQTDSEQEDFSDDDGTENGTMELMAVAVRKEQIETLQMAFRKAGLRLVKVAPSICAYISLIRKQQELFQREIGEYAILDLGYQAVRLHMFQKDCYLTTRELEIGLSALDDVLADVYSTDTRLAHTYLMKNFEDCQNKEECLETYQKISVELMRALNFYRFSNPNSMLSDMWICGGGEIKPLIEAIQDMLDLEMHHGSELIPNGDTIETCNTFVQAIGIAID